MIKILFVDDEQNILDGFRRMLRPMRSEFELTFALGGTEALTLLATKSIDVLISDMKMPGMDGAQLLQAVADRHPSVIRIILSGFSEKELSVKAAGTAHQYLSKPCDPDQLKSVVTRVFELRNLLTDNNLRSLISSLHFIPSLPSLYGQLGAELEKAEPSTRTLGEIIKKDIGMTAKILQIVNSAFFGLGRRISDASEAVEILGLETISSLTLGIGIFSQFMPHGSKSEFELTWKHSVAVGAMARRIAAFENPSLAPDSFTAGLLHDVGKIILWANLPRKFDEMRRIREDENQSESDAELAAFGASHADVGAFLLGLWGLPTAVVQAVAFHHRPEKTGSDVFTAADAVHVADVVEHSRILNIHGISQSMRDPPASHLLPKITAWQHQFNVIQTSMI